MNLVAAPSLAIFLAAAFFEIAGCFAFWAWARLAKSAWWLLPGGLSLLIFAWLLTLAPTDAAGRAYAVLWRRLHRRIAAVALGRRAPAARPLGYHRCRDLHHRSRGHSASSPFCLTEPFFDYVRISLSSFSCRRRASAGIEARIRPSPPGAGAGRARSAAAHPAALRLLARTILFPARGRRGSARLLRVLRLRDADIRSRRDLPMPDQVQDDDHPAVHELREHSLWSEGQVWCSPERHGQITGNHEVADRPLCRWPSKAGVQRRAAPWPPCRSRPVRSPSTA
jgi:hypothetical protein